MLNPSETVPQSKASAIPVLGIYNLVPNIVVPAAKLGDGGYRSLLLGTIMERIPLCPIAYHTILQAV